MAGEESTAERASLTRERDVQPHHRMFVFTALRRMARGGIDPCAHVIDSGGNGMLAIAPAIHVSAEMDGDVAPSHSFHRGSHSCDA
jgi:hypothetical protein